MKKENKTAAMFGSENTQSAARASRHSIQGIIDNAVAMEADKDTSTDAVISLIDGMAAQVKAEAADFIRMRFEEMLEDATTEPDGYESESAKAFRTKFARVVEFARENTNNLRYVWVVTEDADRIKKAICTQIINGKTYYKFEREYKDAAALSAALKSSHTMRNALQVVARKEAADAKREQRQIESVAKLSEDAKVKQMALICGISYEQALKEYKRMKGEE